jgi:hypothetical protein
LRFWDGSVVMPLILEEAPSEAMSRLLAEDDEVAVWWGTWVECTVAINRLVRDGRIDEEAGEDARGILDELAADWMEIEPAADMRLLASLVSRDHPPKAADSLQLPAALRWCGGGTREAGFVCLDNRLREAAHGEGCTLLPSDPTRTA